LSTISDAETDKKKVYIRIILDPRDPMDMAIIKEIKKQRKKKMGQFVKFAVFCYIKGVDISSPLTRKAKAQEYSVKTTKETDPTVTRAIKEIGDIEF